MAITLDGVDAAANEARRFLARVAELKRAALASRHPAHECGVQKAAVRRASMDLTRALANLRKGGQHGW